MEKELEEYIKLISEKIPRVDENINYWFIRANSGVYYDSFKNDNFVGISWNDISLKVINEVSSREQLTKEVNLKQKKKLNNKRPGSAAAQLLTFVREIKPGDFIIVPSENSSHFLIGKAIGDPYEVEIDENKIKLNECPYKKRRNVAWLRQIPRKKIDNNILKLIYSGHTITTANKYKKEFTRSIYDTYIIDGTCHFTLYINKQDSIDLEVFSNLISQLSALKETSQDKIYFSNNIQSPGWMELAGKITTIIFIGLVVTGVTGGKVKNRTKIGKQIELENHIETPGLFKSFYDNIWPIIKYKIDKKSTRNDSIQDLKVDKPSEIAKAIEIVDEETTSSNNPED